MSDVAPSPIKGGQQANKNQVILVAVLGVVLLLVLVFLVLKPFGGGDEGTAPVTPQVTAPAAGAPATGAAAGTPAAPAETPEAGPAPARSRNPFDPPR